MRGTTQMDKLPRAMEFLLELRRSLASTIMMSLGAANCRPIPWPIPLWTKRSIGSLYPTAVPHYWPDLLKPEGLELESSDAYPADVAERREMSRAKTLLPNPNARLDYPDAGPCCRTLLCYCNAYRWFYFGPERQDRVVLPVTFNYQAVNGRLQQEASKWTCPFFVQSHFYLDIPQVSHLRSLSVSFLARFVSFVR